MGGACHRPLYDTSGVDALIAATAATVIPMSSSNWCDGVYTGVVANGVEATGCDECCVHESLPDLALFARIYAATTREHGELLDNDPLHPESGNYSW